MPRTSATKPAQFAPGVFARCTAHRPRGKPERPRWHAIAVKEPIEDRRRAEAGANDARVISEPRGDHNAKSATAQRKAGIERRLSTIAAPSAASASATVNMPRLSTKTKPNARAAKAAEAMTPRPRWSTTGASCESRCRKELAASRNASERKPAIAPNGRLASVWVIRTKPMGPRKNKTTAASASNTRNPSSIRQSDKELRLLIRLSPDNRGLDGQIVPIWPCWQG